MLSEKFGLIEAISPASATNATATGKYVNMGLFDQLTGILSLKTGGTNTGTFVVTVVAATDNSGTGAAAVPFRYRKKTTGLTSDTWGAVTSATSSGFTTTANEDTLYEIEVLSSEVVANASGSNWVAIRLTQGTADTLAYQLNYVLGNLHYAGQSQPTVLA